jgi:acetoin utilization deacetylase AcuC-like enzyme
MKRVLIIDIDMHHGGGIEEILTSPTYWDRQRKVYGGDMSDSTQVDNGLEILYYSMFQEGSYDSKPACLPRGKWKRPVDVHRVYSSRQGSKWSARETAERSVILCEQVVEYGESGGFDAVVVAAGFDHCVGERLDEGKCPRGIDKLWTIEQVKDLGRAIHKCAGMCRLLKHPVSVLEGGYEKNTLETILPAYIDCTSGKEV